jgi:hypothetical protein
MKIWSVILAFLLSNSIAQALNNENDFINIYSSAPVVSLKKAAATTEGIERGIVLMFITASDSNSNDITKQALAILDSAYKSSSTSIHAVLLGTVEAIMARDTKSDEIAATKWIARSLKHLDEAIKADSQNVTFRIFRINALVTVPEIFKVNNRLNSDALFLKQLIGKKFRQADISSLMALASVSYRFGRLNEAIAYWKIVVAREKPESVEGAKARAMLEMVNGK